MQQLGRFRLEGADADGLGGIDSVGVDVSEQWHLKSAFFGGEYRREGYSPSNFPILADISFLDCGMLVGRGMGMQAAEWRRTARRTRFDRFPSRRLRVVESGHGLFGR